MNLKINIVNLLRKTIGIILIVFSSLFFGATVMLLAQGDYGPFLVGLFFSILLFGLGLSIQTNIQKLRACILAVFQKYFPRCPICKAAEGYQVRGLFPSSQYVRCKNCKAEWASRDFVDAKDLRTLKLWNHPEEPQIYADFITSINSLKLKKSYPTNLWQASMNGEKIELQPSAKQLGKVEFNDAVSNHKGGFLLCFVALILLLSTPLLLQINNNFWYFTASTGISIILAIAGFYGFNVSKGNSYVLFCTVLITILVGLLAGSKVF